MTRDEFCNDKALLVSYLYSGCDDGERRAVEAHLAECGACAAEIAGLRAVRGSLSEWETPERLLGIRVAAQERGGPIAGSSQERAPVASRSRWTPPWWLQTAAAVLFFAAAAGLAQVEVRYGADGLVVRTGWGRTAPTTQSAGTPAQAPWRQDLAALEQELRRELSSATRPTAVVATRAPQANEPNLLSRVRDLIEQSEQKQQRELAIRLVDVVRDVDIQRRADQMRVQQTVGQLEGQTDVAVRQNRELLNYLVRVSQQR
jgi:hypothetical protein